MKNHSIGAGQVKLAKLNFKTANNKALELPYGFCFPCKAWPKLVQSMPKAWPKHVQGMAKAATVDIKSGLARLAIF